MPVDYIESEQARSEKGLRMVVVMGVPGPWGEAAKEILDVKKIPWRAVRFDPASDESADWTNEHSAPVVMYNDEAPRLSRSQIPVARRAS